MVQRLIPLLLDFPDCTMVRVVIPTFDGLHLWWDFPPDTSTLDGHSGRWMVVGQAIAITSHAHFRYVYVPL